MQKKQIKHLVWFRNDLRVNDNDVLTKASIGTNSLLAVYCVDPRHFEMDQFEFKKTEKFRARFLLETLKNLKENLRTRGISLLIFQDKPEDIIPKVCDEFGIEAIFFQKEWTFEERKVENKLQKQLTPKVKLVSLFNQFLFHPHDLGINFKEIPKVFTVFRKHVEKQCAVRPEVEMMMFSKDNLIENNDKIPSLTDLGFEDFVTHPNSAFTFKGGETEALNRLNNYFFESKKLGVYKKTRNGLVGIDYSSKFSAWLANGSISTRTIYWNIKRFEKEHFKNDSTYWLIFELIWRDYFKYVSLKHGDDIFKIGGILKVDYDWYQYEKDVNNWINGNTKEPFVNANMLELKQTGWMSNRGRQNVASYFAKTLKLDWRIGAAYFESLLLDYDVHSNYGNWMYVAGVGNDPRDRVFNVQLQANNYDPHGKFQRLWLQETLF
jgi:deoxyribodipyrimidine photo-lyase